MSRAATAMPDRSAISPMTLLQQGIPVSLLIDLALGPRSEELFRAERHPAEPAATG